MRPFIVGIAGGTASGKTTLATRLAVELGATLISHDRYYRDAPEPHRHNFDHPEALETELLVQHLDALHAGEAVDLPVYDFALHQRRSEVDRVDPQPFMIVEGILVLADARLCDRFDLRVYVQAPDDLRFIRRLERDVAERGRTVGSVIHQYLATVRPMHEAHVAPSLERAQVVLDGTSPVEGEVERLMAWLPRRGR